MSRRRNPGEKDPIERGREYVVRRVVAPIQQFINTEVFSGTILLAAAVIALIWANSPFDEAYTDLFGEKLTIDGGIFRIDEDLRHWINDALMTFFFFVVGLEIKRELTQGELAGINRALLPGIGALGGMVAPALIYTAFNYGGDGADGWGVPMATDIAFALGVMALLGRRIPSQVRVFLLALAIVDDIGAILVIAVFYTGDLQADSLAIAAGLLGVVYVMQRAGIREYAAYFVVGAFVWIAVFESGVHATIAGVVLGLMTPLDPHYSPGGFRDTMQQLLESHRAAAEAGDEERANELLTQIEELTEGTEAPLQRLEAALHPYTSFIIIPLFALANAGVSLDADALEESVSSSITIGVALGLLIGKPLGIFLFSWAAVRLGIATLPRSASWAQMFGAGMLGGVGFTVALFVNELAFDAEEHLNDGKIGILAGSLVAGLGGYLFLLLLSRDGARSETQVTSDDG